MASAKQPVLLVTGGSGNLGRRVLELLCEKADAQILTTTRTPEKLRDLAERGVEVRRADHDDPTSLAQAYRGVDRILIISTDDIGRRFEQVRNVVKAAEAAGVQHLVYTSTLGARPDPDDAVTNDHFWSELAIMSSSLSWTILRHAMYTEHIYLYLPIAVKTGKLLSAMGDGGRSYVTREDCAHVDAAVLDSVSTDCRIYDVTGSEVVGQGDLAALASEITGRHVQYVHATPQESRADWIAGGLQPNFADGLLEFDLLARQGYHGIVAPTVKRFTGREPQTVRDYIYRNRQDLFPDDTGQVKIDVHMARPTME